MALINTPKSFDKAQMDSATLTKIETFVDYVNQQFDQVTRALQNQLTFAENFKASVITLSAYHNKELSLSATAAGIIPLSVLGDSIQSYYANVSNAGTQKITFRFGNPVSIRTRSVTYSAPFATYEVESIATLQVGDRVSIVSSTTNLNASNSGTFVVSQVNAGSITVYNSNAVATALTEYVGTQEAAKTVTLLLLS